ncbi:MAG TPA: hypothetical protein VLM40_21485 [Gemmata sp.]|nr:hypothetical protein [Gemmata sp.]
MTLFGKILLVLNLLLAAGFVYLATQDWQGRQNITAAALRHGLLVVGLPLGDAQNDLATLPNEPDAEVPFRVLMAGDYPTRTVSAKLIQTYFANNAGGETPLGSGPVPNQLAEVKRVKAKTDELLAAAPDKVAALEGWLLLQAETYDEREAIQTLVREKNADELQKRLAAKFAAVLDAPKLADAETAKSLAPGDPEDPKKLDDKIAQLEAARSASQDEGDRRSRIAHLLVHLNTDPAWQKRVAVIVGLRQYVLAIVAQTDRFRQMAERVEMQIYGDQDVFQTDVTTQLGLAIDRTELAARQAKLKLKWQEQKTKEDDFVAQRKTELDAIKAQLRKIKEDVDELLVRQGKIESALFAVQREVAITLDEVYQLEARLAARERELLMLPPAPKGN